MEQKIFIGLKFKAPSWGDIVYVFYNSRPENIISTKHVWFVDYFHINKIHLYGKDRGDGRGFWREDECVENFTNGEWVVVE